jgi:hypothetical protein
MGSCCPAPHRHLWWPKPGKSIGDDLHPIIIGMCDAKFVTSGNRKKMKEGTQTDAISDSCLNLLQLWRVLLVELAPPSSAVVRCGQPWSAAGHLPSAEGGTNHCTSGSPGPAPNSARSGNFGSALQRAL